MSLQGIHRDAPSLRELQRGMAAQILAADPQPRAPLGRWLAVPPGAAPSERLAVHVDGYAARLHEALAEEFPAVAHLVGHTVQGGDHGRARGRGGGCPHPLLRSHAGSQPRQADPHQG
jgi:hypothetical protein